MTRQLIIFFSFLLFAADMRGQGQDVVRSYSTENGLPSNGILGMQWDEKTGFLWIATEAGLVRYNGIDFKVFTRENKRRIATDRMVFLLRDYNGKIFTADRLSNTYHIENNRVLFYKKFPRVNNNPPNLFLIGISEKFAEKNILRKNKFSYYLPFERIATLDDSTCIFQKDNMLIRYGQHEEREIMIPEAYRNTRKIFSIDSHLFILSKNGIYLSYNPESETATRVSIADENGKAILPAGKHSNIYWENGMKNPILFIGSDAWILRYENGTIKAEHFTQNMPEDAFISFAQYSEEMKILFIGTDSKGIVTIRKSRLTPVKSSQTGIDERNTFYGQIALPNGNILTNEGKILGYSKEPAGPLPVEKGFFFSAFSAGDSTLWYSLHGDNTMSRLRQYDYKSGQTRRFDKVHFSEQAPVVKSGNDYFIATPQGIGKITGDSLQYLIRFAVANLVYDIKEYSRGVFLIPSCGGLLRYRAIENKLDTILNAGENCVRTVTILQNKYAFIGTFGKGIFLWDGKILKELPLDRFKYLLYAHCFVPDGSGFCWISTNNGLFKASLSEMIRTLYNPTEQVYYHYFGKRDGMEITELNGGCQPCAIVLKNGTISFPSMDGLLWVNPGKSEQAFPSGKIFIDDFFIDGKRIPADSLDKSPLPAETKEITINVGYDGWAGKENVYLQYKLNGSEKWIDISLNTNSELRLNNLRAGDHELMIRKINGFGTGNHEVIKLSFSIRPKWYQQIWFFIFSGLILLGLILLLYKWRLHQLQKSQKKLEGQVTEKTMELQIKNDALEKANSIKNRLISIISHDIITPLKFLNVAGKNLLEKKETMPDKLQRETLEEMTNTARELQFLSTNILNLIKYQSEKRIVNKEKFHVHRLVEEVFGILRATSSQKKIGLENIISPSLEIYQYYDLLRILIYNLVLNGLNFSDKGNIRVSSITEGEELIMTVKDDGVGMTKEQINNILSDEYIISSTNIDKRKGNGLGYLIIKDLAAMMKATISIQSEPGRGTAVSIRLPVRKRQKKV